MPNVLIHETSPYLLQHAHNPVNWMPWGAAAFERARAEDKPVFLSIGYAACHWCHVMERESFENEAIAAVLNEHFISIKVDREERPDIDDIYMSAVQMMTGSGGWPMSMFLTPDGRPFIGGTYFPPEDRWGRPGFMTVLRRVAEFYQTRGDEIRESGDQITDIIGQGAALGGPGEHGAPDAAALERAEHELLHRFDEVHGGFGGAPKFPPSMALRLLMRRHARGGSPQLLRVVTATLDAMARGGIYDHLAGGFARYSTDAEWLVPHFEKMLYDNALLAPVYLDAHCMTGDGFYLKIARETLDWVLREMTDAEGGFHATLDADSGGVEGLTYTWRPEEVDSILGAADGDLFRRHYGVVPGGNWHEGGGASILHAIAPADEFARANGMTTDELEVRLAPMRAKLLAVRATRVQPGKDDKIITAWNGLMISALARGAQVTGDAKYGEAAAAAARFILSRMRRPDGGLFRTFRAGRAHVDAFLEDYAFMLCALADLYETTFDTEWLDEARALGERMIADFHDAAGGGFFTTDGRDATLVARLKDTYDGATPSGNAMAVMALDRLGVLLGLEEWRAIARKTVEAMGARLAGSPGGHHQMLCALDRLLNPSIEVAVAGEPDSPETRAFFAPLWKTWRPDLTLAAGIDGAGQPCALLRGRAPKEGAPLAYVCRDNACQAPVATPEAMLAALGE